MGKRSDLREAYKKRRGVPSLLNPTDDEHRYTAAKKQFDSLVHLLHLVQHSPVPIPELEMKNAVSLALEEVERWSQEVERLDLRLGHTLRLGDPEEILPPFLTAVDDLDVKVSACEYFGRSAMPRSDRLAVMAQGRRARLRYAARMAKVCHDKVVIRQIEDPAHASALQALAAATLDELDALPRLRNLSTEELVRATIRIHDAAISLDHFLDRLGFVNRGAHPFGSPSSSQGRQLSDIVEQLHGLNLYNLGKASHRPRLGRRQGRLHGVSEGQLASCYGYC